MTISDSDSDSDNDGWADGIDSFWQRARGFILQPVWPCWPVKEETNRGAEQVIGSQLAASKHSKPPIVIA